MADDATLEGAVLKRPVQGRDNIVGLLKHAKSLYDFQEFIYKDYISKNLFMESYRATVRGVPVECVVLVHMNDNGEADSLVINHFPIGAALLFGQLMWEKVGDEFGNLYLTPAETQSLEAVIPRPKPDNGDDRRKSGPA
ncbi:hypothetical protein [Paraburkholderia solisilvae]|uniref:Uncharacterized protein n=1 Tax=Paraburkholderia solisilvae TaxID=624376 RepID=A0A6J5F1S7_9BURK|nr:hypothetical protein [Paraburkholderia solisilvae]CAB3771667.1 hypothetical protein LMG29739_06083 [Paraburkholderia solisilvae]